jgi:hypothetical protein
MTKFTVIYFLAASAMLSISAAAQDADSVQKIQSGAYEQCAVRVFQNTTKVSDVFKACEAEMNAYLSRYDKTTRVKIQQKIKVETRRALTEKTLQKSTDED